MGVPNTVSNAASARAAACLLPVVYLGFVSLGLPDGTLGVAWPAVYPELGLPVGLAGAIMIVITLLSSFAGFSSGRVIGRFGTGPVVLASCALTGSALVLISQAQGAAWFFVAAVPLGLGAGAVDAGLNSYVARHYTGRHMNWLHACWGVGATAGPVLMAQVLGAGPGWRGGYLLLGGAQLSMALMFFLTLRWWGAVPERAAAGGGEHTGGRRTPTLGANSAAGWLSPTIFALYVAVEITTALWAGSILVASRGIAEDRAALIASCYFGAITVGRVATGFVVDRVGNRRIVSLGLLLALAGAVVFAATSSALAAVAGLAMIGLGFAPVYPGLMHEVPRRFAPEAVATVIGRQSGASNIGAAILPAATGVLAQHSLAAVPWVLAGGIVLVILCVRRLDRMT